MRTLKRLGGAGESPAAPNAPIAAAASAARRATRAGAAEHGAHAAGELGRHGRALHERLAEQLRGGGERLRLPVVLGRRDRHRIGRGVEEHRGDVDAGDAVDERVVGLRQQRKAIVGQPLDEPQLPQGPSAVERLAEHPPREPLELGVPARARQRRVADMEPDVEVRVVDPHRPALAERDERQPLAVARNEMQARLDRRHELLVGGSRAGEDRAAGDVHMRGVALEVQKRRVEARQAVGIGHRMAILAGALGCDQPHTRPEGRLSPSPSRPIGLPNHPCSMRG